MIPESKGDSIDTPLICAHTPHPSAAADAADESGTSALDSSTNTSSGGGGGFFAGLGLGSFGLGGDLLEEEEGDEGEEGDMDDDYTGWGEGLWAGLLGGGGGGSGGGGGDSVEARYNVGHWQALYEGLQQARHPRYYDEVSGWSVFMWWA